ncbi:MAG: (d)CMP kinase [Alphaproteobacteria bacterium]|nr:(d)CMP kinase [Alphaproteobacteria bacterium]MBV8549299.1 (d)CMP kinase [Alphaproteobacteria bacterium]
MQQKPTIIAVDGTSASGKGTLAERIAATLGFAYLDTGLLYRAVAYQAVQDGGQAGNAADAIAASEKFCTGDSATFLSQPELRSAASGTGASLVAAVPEVRTNLLKYQKDFCLNPPGGKAGAVVDGRDIGTVIAPYAPVKLFITASAEERARRRFNQLQARGENVTYDAVFQALVERDTRDATRSVAQTKPAADAVVMDTTTMDAEAVYQESMRIIRQKLGRA